MAPTDKRFGKYRLGSKVAQGGMAEIYRARFEARPGITKQIIIKRILPHYAADAHFIEMFTNEAQIAMGLSHGNIAQVFDFGEVDGAWFLAMELVDGPSLSKLLKRARALGIPALPAPLAVMVVAEMLNGLHYAHARRDEQGAPLNIVHRDVSPQNVLVSYEGQVKLVDFGIAKARSAADKTRPGVIKGKYLYFSPEQVRERPLDGRTDVFAAGTLLYQLLTGTVPFDGEVADVLRNIAQGRYVPLSQMNPALPGSLEAIVARALAVKLEDRYPSAGAFSQALSGWLHANAPHASGERLGQFVSYLFSAELEAEGRPPQLDPAYVDEMESWRTGEGEPELATDPHTRFERGKSASGKSASGKSSAGKRRTSSRGRESSAVSVATRPASRRWLWWSAPVAALFCAGVAMVLLAGPPSFELQVSSDPPGGAVSIDGKPVSGATPLALPGLLADHPHMVQVDRAGMKPWRVEVRGQQGAVTLVHANLVPLPPPAPEPEPEPEPAADAGVVAAPDPEREAPVLALWPENHFVVYARRHVLDVPRTVAARLDLDPSRSYQVWLEGKLSFGGRVADIWVDECLYMLEGPGVKAHEAFGTLGRKPVTLRGAQRLYAWINDTSASNHSGAFLVQVKTAGQPQQKLLLDSRRHQLMPGDTSRFTVRNLNPLASYRVTVKAGAVPARTRAEGKPGGVIFGMEAGQLGPSTREAELKPQRLFEVGKSYLVSTSQRIWFYFPDHDVSDNAGSVEVDLEQVGEALQFQVPDLLKKLKKR